MNIHEFLVSPLAHLAPEKTLEDLSETEAVRRIGGAPHSVAEIIAHLAFWQDWFYARCTGQAAPMAATAGDGWPAVSGDSWCGVRLRFTERLHQLAALGEADLTKPVSPAIEFPPLATYTLGDALIHVATHNAHHLGQVITLRQLMNAWPPPAGSWTW